MTAHGKVEILVANQLVKNVRVGGNFAGRIVNMHGKGRWIFRASSTSLGDADGRGPLEYADGWDVTRKIHSAPESIFAV